MIFGHIPRLDEVAAIIRFQEKRYDGSGPPPDGPSGQDIPLGSRLLKVALDYDTLICSGFDKARALAAMRERSGWYDPRVFEAFATLAKSREGFTLSDVAPGDLTPGMVLAGDLTVDGGVVASGTIVDQELLSRLKRAGDQAPDTVAVYAPPEVDCALCRLDPELADARKERQHRDDLRTRKNATAIIDKWVERTPGTFIA